MSLLGRLERRLGQLAVPHLTVALIVCQAVVYLATFATPHDEGPPPLLGWLQLVPDRVLEGQVWRVVTFVAIPPLGLNLIFALLAWYFFYLMGTTLEAHW